MIVQDNMTMGNMVKGIFINGKYEHIITCYKSTDISYLFHCAKQYPYHNYPINTTFNKVLGCMEDLCVIGYDGEPAGCLFISKVKDNFFFDAYRDVTVKTPPFAAYVAGEGFLLKYKHRPLYSAHDIRNRAATMMLKKLGFEHISKLEMSDNTYNLFVLEEGE